jgi:hypothetical protein
MSPDASQNPTNDLALEAAQLQAKYDGLAGDSEWGEHPNHPMEEWRNEVHCKNTRVGYWDWVVTKLKLADNKNNEDPVLADAEEEEIAELQADDPGNQGA